MTGREDNIAEESALAILPVCLFCCYLFVVSLMLTMVEGQLSDGPLPQHL